MSMSKKDALKKIDELKEYVDNCKDEEIVLGSIVIFNGDLGVVISENGESRGVLFPSWQGTTPIQGHECGGNGSHEKLFDFSSRGYNCCWNCSVENLTLINKEKK